MRCVMGWLTRRRPSEKIVAGGLIVSGVLGDERCGLEMLDSVVISGSRRLWEYTRSLSSPGGGFEPWSWTSCQWSDGRWLRGRKRRRWMLIWDVLREMGWILRSLVIFVGFFWEMVVMLGLSWGCEVFAIDARRGSTVLTDVSSIDGSIFRTMMMKILLRSWVALMRRSFVVFLRSTSIQDRQSPQSLQNTTRQTPKSEKLQVQRPEKKDLDSKKHCSKAVQKWKKKDCEIKSMDNQLLYQLWVSKNLT